MSNENNNTQTPPATDEGLLKRCLGIVFGVCGGDALGAPLEKIGRKPTRDEVDVST